MDITARLEAVGIVHCIELPQSELRFGQKASIEVFDQFLPALKRIEEHDYYWIVCWLDRADRNVLETHSWHLKKTDIPYGVFSLRSPCRPNPISLTLVRLLGVKGNTLIVDGLDVFDGTAVLDIKPYRKSETVFSPKAPYLRPQTRQFIQKMLYQKALFHHKEECAYLQVAVRMALEAEEMFGDVSDDGLIVSVKGNPCLADAIQGITCARLSNPPRFSYTQGDTNECVWDKGGTALVTRLKLSGPEHISVEEIGNMETGELFYISAK
jgi:tRNA-Thr(GGU) m(6)t(6)A37 methyltransferase TsaA